MMFVGACLRFHEPKEGKLKKSVYGISMHFIYQSTLPSIWWTEMDRGEVKSFDITNDCYWRVEDVGVFH